MATLLRSDNTWKCLGYLSGALTSVSSLTGKMNSFLGTTQLALNMTSNTTPAPYVVSASSIYNSTFDAWKAFNGTNVDSNDCWVSASGQLAGWIEVDFGAGNEKTVAQYCIISRNYSDITSAPKDWTLEGSNDGTNWVVLDTRNGEAGWSTNETRTYSFSNPTAYRYYRLNISANNGYSYIAIGELRLYAAEFVLSSVVVSNEELRLAPTPGSGECISPQFSLYGFKSTGVPVISWDGSATGVTCEVDVSLDGGTTWSSWQPVSNGGTLPGVDATTNLDNVRFRYKLTLTSDTDVSPVVGNIRIENIVDWVNVLYNDSFWATVYDNGAYGVSPWTTQVVNWPDSQASWIWDRASTSSAPAGDVYFRKKFTLAEPKWVTIALVCDDKGEFYVDGQYLLGNANWKSTFANTIYLSAGDHVIAIKGTNSAAGTAGLLVTVRDAFAGLVGSGVLTGNRLARVFDGIKTAITFGLRQARNLIANVYVVDIFNTGPSTRKVGDYFLGVRSSIDQEVGILPPSGEPTPTQYRRFPRSWVPQLWKLLKP